MQVADTTTEDSVESRRSTLRAAAASSPTPYRTVTSDGRKASHIPWGAAMASAQKSIRAGASIVDVGGGTFVLTSADGSNWAVFEPARKPV